MPELAGAYTGTKARVRYSGLDTNGVRRERYQTYEVIGAGVDDAAKEADAKLNAAALVTDIGTVSEAEVTLVGLRHEYGNNGFSGSIVANVYARAVLTCQNATLGKSNVTVSWLAPADGLVSGSNIIRTAADVNTFLNNFKDGNADQTATVSDGDAVVDGAANAVITGDKVKFESSGSTF